MSVAGFSTQGLTRCWLGWTLGEETSSKHLQIAGSIPAVNQPGLLLAPKETTYRLPPPLTDPLGVL